MTMTKNVKVMVLFFFKFLAINPEEFFALHLEIFLHVSCC